ncbi:hypothetical protein K0651_01950 [Ornithinimicrobium sp. Arc0846-15]|nr:hypothetical protein [Ornithinimicrobium laminariae]
MTTTPYEHQFPSPYLPAPTKPFPSPYHQGTPIPQPPNEAAKHPRPICFVDVETDGLDPNCRPWEIAIIRRAHNNAGRLVDTEHHMFVKLDGRPATDHKALAIGGYYERHPEGRRISEYPKPPLDSVVNIHTAAAQAARITHNATLVGAGVHFDADVLARLLRSQGQIPSWHYRLRCVTTLASAEAGRDTGGLDESLAELGLDEVPAAERHTAMGDASAARSIWDAVMVLEEPHRQDGDF